MLMLVSLSRIPVQQAEQMAELARNILGQDAQNMFNLTKRFLLNPILNNIPLPRTALDRNVCNTTMVALADPGSDEDTDDSDDSTDASSYTPRAYYSATLRGKLPPRLVPILDVGDDVHGPELEESDEDAAEEVVRYSDDDEEEEGDVVDPDAMEL